MNEKPGAAAVWILCAVLALACVVTTTTAAVGQQPDAVQAESSEPQPAKSGFWNIVFSGGLVGFAIIMVLFLLSVAAVALVIEHAMTIRRDVLLPPNLSDQVRSQLAAGNLAQSQAQCRQQPSFLAFVLQAGLSEADGGWAAVEKGMEDATAEQSARLFRKIEYLSVIGNIAPMVGLLGTVTGMIFAFQRVADTQGAPQAAELAEGIYQALVTTVGGLIVAIPALAAFAVFRNRVDQFVAEATYAAQHATTPLKRLVRKNRAKNPPPSPPPAPANQA